MAGKLNHKLISMIILANTIRLESKLAAHNTTISSAPSVVTYSSPCSVVANLQSTTCCCHFSSQLKFTIRTIRIRGFFICTRFMVKLMSSIIAKSDDFFLALKHFCTLSPSSV